MQLIHILFIFIGPKDPWCIPNLTTEGTCLPLWILWVTKYPFWFMCWKAMPQLGIEPKTFRIYSGWLSHQDSWEFSSHNALMFCWLVMVQVQPDSLWHTTHHVCIEPRSAPLFHISVQLFYMCILFRHRNLYPVLLASCRRLFVLFTFYYQIPHLHLFCIH